MRDFRASYPDRECIEGYVVAGTSGVMQVQGFAGGNDYYWCPEYGYSVPRSQIHPTYEAAARQAVERAEYELTRANESLAKAQALSGSEAS